MPSRTQRIIDWFDLRLGIRTAVLPILTHPVPRGLGWYYVFGSATLTMFMMQIVTGICLAVVYVPAASDAYTSLEYLNNEQPLGWLLRAVHYWSATGMVVLISLHATRVFLMGAFKYPRELTWILGVFLLLLTLGLAFTGQVLRWDQDAYWGVGVGAAMVGRVPFIGPALVHVLLGGPNIGGETLSRFFGLHVFVLPGLTILLLVPHLYLVVRQGISSRPAPGKPVDPKTYEAEYEKEIAAGEPFYPYDFAKDAIFSAICVLVIFALAISFGPKGPSEPPDPTLIEAEPRPDWYFLPLFALLALSPPEMETAIILTLPVVAVAILLLLPFFAGKGERHPRRRPVAVLVVLLLFLTLGVLGWLGNVAPWSPEMFAWSGTPIPVHIVERLTPEQLQGAAVFQNKTCRNCHSLDGQGGKRGPDLTLVATRLSHSELIRQVIQGGGNMPAYGKQLSPAEVEALVSFLGTLRREGEPLPRSPAADETKN
ncbi:MAG: cytochrome b N-terminal domain-containing protein [Planctomycetia bacterium]|nr:cytochrome b N-terminal domain-containing protein [Planctomycetia bacterium]